MNEAQYVSFQTLFRGKKYTYLAAFEDFFLPVAKSASWTELQSGELQLTGAPKKHNSLFPCPIDKILAVIERNNAK